MQFFAQIFAIVQQEARFLRQHPKEMLTGLVLVFVPALYCVLYITSVWAPESKTNALPVAIVNLDQGILYRGHQFNVGWEIATRLEDSGRFGFSLMPDEQQARALVRQGKLAFAVIIPSDFSANAVPGAEAGAGKVVIYTSQGNNFETATIAKQFAQVLGREINEKLNERRWILVLHNAAGTQQTMENLRSSLDKLSAKANTLSKDTAKTRAIEDQQTQTQKLSADIHQLAKTLPRQSTALEGSAEGLASSVEPVVEIDAPVANSGSGFAANFVPGSLWLGAAMAAFLIHIQVLPRSAQHLRAPVQVLGKMFLPACMIFLQALMVIVTVLFVLGIRVVHPWAFALTLGVAALTFLTITFALAKAFGDAGQGITMFLLAVQLSASGGILPVELSGGLFAQISPWLPLTWVVESIKASMFGAYESAWQPPLLMIALAGLGAFGLACRFGRWRFV